MKIGVIGGGVVGRATARAWLEHCDEVRIYDVNKARSTHGPVEVAKCDWIFVCLPELSLDNPFVLKDRVARVGSPSMGSTYVIRSTTPIGTCRRIAAQYDMPKLLHWPEFLTARCAMTDAQCPARNVVGGQPGPQRIQFSNLLAKRFPGVATHWLSWEGSEMVKLMTNAAFAAKVALWNEFRSLADAIFDGDDEEWEAIRQAILADGRIGASHTMVPGPDGQHGFGGSCLPKDVKHLADALIDAGLPHHMLSAALTRNTKDRKEK
jgi:UDPglucose 6-dehydrogenase